VNVSFLVLATRFLLSIGQWPLLTIFQHVRPARYSLHAPVPVTGSLQVLQLEPFLQTGGEREGDDRQYAG